MASGETQGAKRKMKHIGKQQDQRGELKCGGEQRRQQRERGALKHDGKRRQWQKQTASTMLNQTTMWCNDNGKIGQQAETQQRSSADDGAHRELRHYGNEHGEWENGGHDV